MVVLIVISGVSVADPSTDAATAQLSQALDHYSKLEFAQAKGLLAQIDRDDLSENDQRMLDRYTHWVDLAAQRKAAAAALLAAGDQAVSDGDLARARDCYSDAYACEFLDADSRRLARERLTVVQHQLADAENAPQTSSDQPETAVVLLTSLGTEDPAMAPGPVEPEEAVTLDVDDDWDGRPVFDVADHADDSVTGVLVADADAAADTDLQPADTLVVEALEEGDKAPPALAESVDVDTDVVIYTVQGPAEPVVEAVVETETSNDEILLADVTPVYVETEDIEPRGATPESYVATDHQPVATGSSPALTKLEQGRRLFAGKTRVDFDEAMKKAREAYAKAQRHNTNETDFNAARGQLGVAQDALIKGKNYLPPDEYDARQREINALLKLVNDRHTKWTAVQADKARKQMADEEAHRQAEAARQRAEKIATLEDRARDRIRDFRYDQALGVVKDILKLDGKNIFAVDQLNMLEQFVLLQKQKSIGGTVLQEQEQALLDIRESEVPWNELLIYPEDWRELSYKRRMQFARDKSFGSEEDRMAYLSLKKRVGQLDFDEVAFGDIIQYLRDVTGAGIHVKWNSLMPVGVTEETQVTLHLPDRTLNQVLKLMLEDMGDMSALSFTIEDGVIKISTRDDLRTNTMVRVYDIQDLIIRVPDFVGPRVDVAEALGEGGEEASGGFLAEEDEAEEELTRQEMIDALIESIENSVDPDSWTGAGASIEEQRGSLIIMQTPENHLEIQQLLDNMRETRAIQIAIESRFVEVTTGWLERVGVDLDIILNAGGNVGTLDKSPTSDTQSWNRGIPRTGGAVGGTTNPNNYLGDTVMDPMTGLGVFRHPGVDSWTERLTPIKVSGGSKVSWTTLATGIAGDIGDDTDGAGVPTALSIAGAFMDDIEVDFLIEATQGSSTARTLTAPRLTLYNGQRAYVTVATQTAYIRGWEPLVAEGSAAMRPIVGFVPTGTVMDVEATVSADRRYVTMTIRPQVAQLAVSPPRSVPFSVGSGIGVLTSAAIELPEVALKDLQTTISCPDGGTLLLGGQKLAGEVEREVGPPVLSKVPVLNRFFTARGTTRDERTLLILVKPRIIIQREYESEAFP